MNYTQKNVEDLNSTEKFQLEEYKNFYNHPAMNDAKEELQDYMKKEFKMNKEDLDLEEDIISAIADKEEHAPVHDDKFEVKWCDRCECKLLIDREKVEICERCREEDSREPKATVHTNMARRPLRIAEYTNETEYEIEPTFEAEWVSTDGWRGYHTIEAPDGWKKVSADNILTSWNDKKKNKKYDKMKEECEELGINYAIVSSRTSNVFSNNADFYVKGKENRQKIREVLN